MYVIRHLCAGWEDRALHQHQQRTTTKTRTRTRRCSTVQDWTPMIPPTLDQLECSKNNDEHNAGGDLPPMALLKRREGNTQKTSDVIGPPIKLIFACHCIIVPVSQDNA